MNKRNGIDLFSGTCEDSPGKHVLLFEMYCVSRRQTTRNPEDTMPAGKLSLFFSSRLFSYSSYIRETNNKKTGVNKTGLEEKKIFIYAKQVA